VIRAPAAATGWLAALAGLAFAALGVALLVAAAGGSLEAPAPLLALGAALFLGGGAAIAWQGWRGAQRARLAALHPRQPWRWDHPWDPGGALDDAGARARRALLRAALLAAFLLPFNALMATRGQDFPLASVAVVDLAPLALLAHGGWLLARRRRHGTSRLRFHRFPYFLGEPLELALHLGQRAPLVRALEVSLACVERRAEEAMGESGPETRWAEVELWRATQALRGARQLDLRFELPSDGRDLGTDLVSGAERRWTLRVRGRAPGMGYDARFLVPIYARPPDDGDGAEPAGGGSGRR
jgi:hypothetical protein